MRFDRKSILLVGIIAGTTIGGTCIPTVNDEGRIVVNVQDVSGHYTIAQNSSNFGNPNNCVTKSVSDYLDSDYGTVVGGRIVDVRYKANGQFAGNVVNGVVTVNGATLLTYSGPWSALLTEQSLLAGSSIIVKVAAGETALTTAVMNGSPITLCVAGGFSPNTPAGLSVDVAVDAQVDVNPD